MAPVETTHPSDPIFILPWESGLRLRIGENRQGKSRSAYLTPDQALKLTAQLLDALVTLQEQRG